MRSVFKCEDEQVQSTAQRHMYKKVFDTTTNVINICVLELRSRRFM